MMLASVLAVAALVLSSVASFDAPARASHTDQPNILVIITDDERARLFLSRPKTVRWLKRHGTTFPQAYTPVPLCCPARASVFTGRHVHNHGVRNNDASGNLDQTTTMQRYLDDAGYETRLVGKYLNGWDLNVAPPYFDKWALGKIGAKRGRDNYYGGMWNINGEVRQVNKYSTSFVRDKSISFIEQLESDDDTPWFLYAAPAAPHAPAIPHDKYTHADVPKWEPTPDVLEKNRGDKPEWVRAASVDMDHVDAKRKRQIRTLMSVDDMVDSVMRTLKENGEASETLIFFTSDNGHLLGEHGLMRKKYPYTASIRIPLVVRWPGHVASDVADKRLASLVDVAPTIMDAAGIEIPGSEPMDGRSLFEEDTRDHVFTQLPTQADGGPIPGWRSIRSRDMQYIEYFNSAKEIVEQEYYDLTQDPWQLHNLLGDDDPTNDPNVPLLSITANQDAKCAGSSCP